MALQIFLTKYSSIVLEFTHHVPHQVFLHCTGVYPPWHCKYPSPSIPPLYWSLPTMALQISLTKYSSIALQSTHHGTANIPHQVFLHCTGVYPPWHCKYPSPSIPPLNWSLPTMVLQISLTKYSSIELESTHHGTANIPHQVFLHWTGVYPPWHCKYPSPSIPPLYWSLPTMALQISLTKYSSIELESTHHGTASIPHQVFLHCTGVYPPWRCKYPSPSNPLYGTIVIEFSSDPTTQLFCRKINNRC